jgi:hypothetical protein
VPAAAWPPLHACRHTEPGFLHSCLALPAARTTCPCGVADCMCAALCVAVMAEFMDLLDSPTFKSYGSSLKLLMVAEGEAHIYPRWAHTAASRGSAHVHVVTQQLQGGLRTCMWSLNSCKGVCARACGHSTAARGSAHVHVVTQQLQTPTNNRVQTHKSAAAAAAVVCCVLQACAHE